VVVRHIGLYHTTSVLQLNEYPEARAIPLEDIDLVGRVVFSAVDRVTQIDSRRVPRGDLRDRLGDAGPCEERAGKSTPEYLHPYLSRGYTNRRAYK
jgi:hypothetical protein